MSPRRNWDSPNPSLASECALPTERGGHTRQGVRGWGSPNYDDWRSYLALCLLCAYGKEIPSLTRDLGQIVIYDSSLWRRAQQRRAQECTVCTLSTLWSLL
jgi:hypothetical protein